ncbi:hypothetical protein HMPREF3140_11115 [Klebsiella sp. HMSC16A12]|nr:hypothetical protein HMPREF3140_11115 [Klebsiella sp. HMSC16A12]
MPGIDRDQAHRFTYLDIPQNDDKNGDSCHEVEWIISGNGRMVGLYVSQWLKSN